MLNRTALLALLLPLSVIAPVAGQQVQHGLRVPPGFEVKEFAGSDLANDIYMLTLDPQGRIVVTGRGYIRTLVDEDNDGKADRAIPFSDAPKDGAMGLLWEKDGLLVVGDGGFWRYREGHKGELIRKVKTGGEHTAHALRRGPDGWLYLLCGDGAGINASFAQTDTSPIKDPVGGCVVRFSPDLKKSEIVAQGFRNAYDMDFNPDGELFTFDSDNERCVSLPWYEPTRFYHVVPGGHYGWLAPQRSKWWRLPPYFIDVVPPVTYLGRGSPTGVVCYRHVQFPEKYRGGFFCLDWTFGKIHFLKLEREGSSYKAEKEVFLEATGENGFAPTGAVVHPETGDLYVSIGGRGTRGAVYRIRYTQGLAGASKDRAKGLQPKARSLEWRAEMKAGLLEEAKSKDRGKRLPALQTIERHRARFDEPELVEVIHANWEEQDRLLIQATARLIASIPRTTDLGFIYRNWRRAVTVGLGRLHGVREVERFPIGMFVVGTDDPDAFLASLRLWQLSLGDVGRSQAQGSVWAGYTRRQENTALDKYIRANSAGMGPTTGIALRGICERWLPQAEGPLALECARMLALYAQAEGHQGLSAAAIPVVAGQLLRVTDPVEQTHYLIVLGRLEGHRRENVTHLTVKTLLGLDEALLRRNLTRDSNWPLRMTELYTELARKDPNLNKTLVEHPRFGRAAHALFALTPGFDQAQAARAILKKAKGDLDYPWNASCIKLLGALPPDDSLPVLRSLWGQAGLEAAILSILAKQPVAEDRGKFLSGLKSLDSGTVQLCLDALQKLPGAATPEELLVLLTAWKRAPEKANDLRKALVQRLEQVSGQQFGQDEKAWLAWFSKTQPQLAARLSNPDGVDLEAWNRRLGKIDWNVGDAQRGRVVFTKANCAACHSPPNPLLQGGAGGGSQALGPDLAGVGKRFSRQDLLTTILQPSKDISARYQNWAIETSDGKIHQGLIIYDAVDSLILQTATATVRLAGEQVVSRRPASVSLMPASLLDPLSEREIADLFAFLRE